MKSLRSVNISGQSVLMRVDFNVSINEGKILDDFRIQRVLPTIQFLREKKAKKIILISHLGQPTSFNQKQFSLQPVASYLEKLLEEKIYFVTTLIGKGLKEEIEKLPNNSIILLENIRFYKEEKENNKNFAKELAKIADCFVNEAFSVCHREEASLCAITEFLPSYSGILLEEELTNLDRITQKSEHPLVVILGGAKIKDKISVIERFKDQADYILLGGLMANTILKANGFCIGKSFYDKGAFAQAEKMSIGKAELIFPSDFMVLDKDNQIEIKELGNIAENDKIFDIGPITCDIFSKIILKARTVFFNGPMGKFEQEGFSNGTNKIIDAIIENKLAFSVIGGGETITCFRSFNPKFQGPDSIFLSTGGGAMLKYLIGESLPGLIALNK